MGWDGYLLGSTLRAPYGANYGANKALPEISERVQSKILLLSVIFTVATDRQRHEDPESSSPRAHRKCNDPGICLTLYLCLCSFLQ